MGGKSGARRRKELRPGSRHLPRPLHVGQRCREAPGCGLSRPCVHGPVQCDAESDEDAEIMCRRASKGEKLCSSISLPWKVQRVKGLQSGLGPSVLETG